MERAVLVLFIVIGLAVIGVCIMSTLNFLGIQSIKNDLNSLKEKTRLLEQASGIGDVSQVLNEINVEREKIDNLQLFIDTTVMNHVESLQDQIGSGNDLSEHINVTNSYTYGCTGGFDYYNNPCVPEIVFSTQGTPRWKISKDGNLIPIDNDTYDIGSASYKVRDIYEED